MVVKWYGFMDIGFGIVKYYWCVGKLLVVSEEYLNIECSIYDWMNVGMYIMILWKMFVNIFLGMDLYIFFFFIYKYLWVYIFWCMNGFIL